MKKIYHFLGGLIFAILLIFCTALLAAWGTFYEGVYEGLLFQLLIIGFFLNILISTLRRYPFKKNHIPFIITHLGLLTLITSLFIKSVWGIQGTIPLNLDEPSSKAYKPEKLLIEVQDRNKDLSTYPISRMFTFKNINFFPRKMYPHSQNKLRFWHNGAQATVMGVGTIPFFDKMEDTQPLKRGPWNIYALRKKSLLPPYTIVIYEDSLTISDKKGSILQQSIDIDKAPLYIFEEGFGGYGTSLEVDGYTFFAPLFMEILEHPTKGERALVLEALGKTYTLQEGMAPLPVAGVLARLTPDSFQLPFSLTLKKTWNIEDMCYVLIQIEKEGLELSSQEGISYKGYRLHLSFWDKDHVSLVISRDPLKGIMLYIGIALVSMGTLLILGKRKP